jgi:hypothetical protein
MSVAFGKCLALVWGADCLSGNAATGNKGKRVSFSEKQKENKDR